MQPSRRLFTSIALIYKTILVIRNQQVVSSILTVGIVFSMGCGVIVLFRPEALGSRHYLGIIAAPQSLDMLPDRPLALSQRSATLSSAIERGELMKRAIVGVAFLAAGCASSSGVMQIGPDAYRISAEAYSIGGAEADAMNDATRHCATMGKQVNVTGMANRPYVSYASFASATVNFRCVPRGGT